MNISRQNLAALLKALPALCNPTISELSQEGWVAVENAPDDFRVGHIVLDARRPKT